MIASFSALYEPRICLIAGIPERILKSVLLKKRMAALPESSLYDAYVQSKQQLPTASALVIFAAVEMKTPIKYAEAKRLCDKYKASYPTSLIKCGKNASPKPADTPLIFHTNGYSQQKAQKSESWKTYDFLVRK